MLSMVKNRFGIPGLIAVAALVFAMIGGAYAASKDGGSKAIASKGIRGPRGPRGKGGPTGPTGPRGPAGVNGKDGAAGAPGEKGVEGPTGPAGPTGPKGATGATGAAGATGATGATGAAGATGPAGTTLLSGQTETGLWETHSKNKERVQFPMSFPLQLPVALDPAKIVYLTVLQSETGVTHCPGTAFNPQADAGFLCIYTRGMVNLSEVLEGTNVIPKNGVVGEFLAEEPSEGSFGYGSWAVHTP